MSQTAKKKKQKSNVKKKHQDEWDELLKLIRSQSRELGLPVGSESNWVIRLFEEYAEDNAPFPPKQLIATRPVDSDAWIKVMSAALVSRQCAAYTAFSLSKSYRGLKGLCFWNVDVGDEGAKHLCEALPLLPHCVKLELLDCGLGVAACEHLASSLKQRRTTHLRILHLDHNENIGAQGVARLSEGLFFNSLLHTLSLNYCNIQKEGGLFLRNILMTTDIGIKTLNLEGNFLAREGVMHVAQGLAHNRSLTSLDLRCNGFGGDGAPQLAHEADAVRYLAHAMTQATQLRALNLDGNLLGNLGLELLLQAAPHFTHVREFACTPFVDSDLYRALMDKIAANKPAKTKKKKKKRKSAKKK